MKEIFLTQQDIEKCKSYCKSYNITHGAKSKEIEIRNHQVFMLYKQLDEVVRESYLGNVNAESTTIK